MELQIKDMSQEIESKNEIISIISLQDKGQKSTQKGEKKIESKFQ